MLITIYFVDCYSSIIPKIMLRVSSLLVIVGCVRVPDAPVSVLCISNPCGVFLLLFTGTHTMALLEKLEPGNVYLVKISASNQVGDGPFSNIVELPLKRGNTRSKNPRHSDSFPDTTGKASWRHTGAYTIEASHLDEF